MGLVQRLVVSAVALALLPVAAAACSICLSAVDVSYGERIDNADMVLIVTRPDRSEQPVVTAIVKGEATAVDVMAATGGTFVPVAASGKGLVLVRDGLGLGWSDLGMVGLGYAEWIADVAATQPPPDDPHAAAPDVAWGQRLAIVMEQIDIPDAFVAEIVTGELTRAPYAALRAIGSGLEPEILWSQIRAMGSEMRHAPYCVMLRATGKPEQAALIETRLHLSLEQGDATDAAALLAAYLDIGGPARLDWVEETYLLDRSRSLPEVEAALLALHVHGDIYSDIPRSRVVDAYLQFIRARPQMAGFVAADLAEWQEWGATSDYVALLEAGAIADPAGEFAILAYIGQSADADAKSALDSIQ